MLLINQVRNIGSLPAFVASVEDTALSVGCSVADLMVVMYFESRLNPQAKNPYGSATGLIQFVEATAKALGTSTAELYAMDAATQMAYVKKYFMPFRGRVSDLGNLYLAVFYPKYIGASNDTVVSLSPQWVEANKVFDTNHDGKITVGEIKSTLYAFKTKVAAQFGYAITGTGIALIALFSFFTYKLLS